MSPNTKRVSYFEYLANEAYKEIIGRRADVELTRMEYAGTEADNWKTLDRTHVYQVTAARDDLPRKYFAEKDLLGRCPSLLAVSRNGAGSDTVDVGACTAASVLVFNHTRGNRGAVSARLLPQLPSLSTHP